MVKSLIKNIHSFISLICILLIFSEGSDCAQQHQGLCARVKIEILQELTLERIGFLATLEITNNEGDASITDFAAALSFENPALSNEDAINDAFEMFFVQPPVLKNINAVDGTGIIPPTKTAVVEWFIIPKIETGGTNADGVRYRVGANLAGSIYGKEIASEVLEVIPDIITVKPEPQLEITYFQPRDVDGDNPFTMDIVESPIPFIVGVLVKNAGYGMARQVNIESEQPRIVENKEGLLLIAQLLGARVDDEKTDETSLTVNLGDIQPGKCRKGAWDMITSLSGEFIEFNASFTHASELGGEETSIITDINAYFISHEVINDQPGRDDLLDFLADTDNDDNHLPDTLYESDCNILPVNVLTNITAQGHGMTATVNVDADREGWVYMRLDDPAQAKYDIHSVVRSDGKPLNPNNYWTHIRYERITNNKLTYLNIFDFVAMGDYTYDIQYKTSEMDTDPPETQIRFSGKMNECDGKYYILPETQIYFTVDDASPVGTSYRLDSAQDFLPAYPFRITEKGEHFIEYYSKDNAGNEETVKSAIIVLPADFPEIVMFTSDVSDIYYAGDSQSILPDSFHLNFQGTMTSSSLDAEMDIFQGMLVMPSLSNIPYSRTGATEATITVSGLGVDYYQYHIGDQWGEEFSVSQPIELSGLNTGIIHLYVRARNENGSYSTNDNHIVHVSWEIKPDKSEIEITSSLKTPSRETNAVFHVSGVDLYRYSLDDGYFHPETETAIPIQLTGLSEGEHILSVIGKKGGEWQSQENAATIRMIINRQYGFNFSTLPQVRHIVFEDISSNPIDYEWNGKNDNGAILPPGWYTIRLTVKDELGRATSSLKWVQINDRMPDSIVLAGTSMQKNVHAFNQWAVWQDQQNDNYDIFALDLTDDHAKPLTITTGLLNQERPQTDGKYVVWEDRQLDGNGDIWAKYLNHNEAPFAITESPDKDEQKPVVSFPWVIYQSKESDRPDNPWQLMAYHMISKTEAPVDPTSQDQLDPAIDKENLVWQDFRDAGYGEIYYKNLTTGQIRAITNDPYSQYHPCIYNHWIIWTDKRHTQSDLYGYNLLKQAEQRLTNTPENETNPYIYRKWVVYEEDVAGISNTNLRLIHLDNVAAIQLTHSNALKEKPCLASGKVLWQDSNNGFCKIVMARLPNLYPVYNNQNAVAVTQGMCDYQKDAYGLLELWNKQVGITAITKYESFVPSPVAETVTWENNAPKGNNFTLVPGSFLWLKFNRSDILDLGHKKCLPINLSVGVNVFGYSCFSDQFSAYQLIQTLGIDNVHSVRMLHSNTGKWVVATVIDDKIVGEDFEIPGIAVIMLDMKEKVDLWRP